MVAASRKQSKSERQKAMCSMFAKKVSEATPSEASGLYFLAGQYPVIQVDQLKLITSTKPGRIGAEMFVAVFDILDSRVQDRPAGMRAVDRKSVV